MRRTSFRVVDTGLGSAALNIGLDRAWMAGHLQGTRDNLLRFYRSTPSAWLGLHEWPERELWLLYCHRKDIEVVRRLTGGGTLYVDPHQLGFSLILKWSERLAGLGEAGVLERGAAAVIAALRELGMPARFKAPNDVEVAGRKIASLFVSRQRGSLLLQGVLLLTADINRVLGALRLPSEPVPGPDGPVGARERLTALDRLYDRPPPPARLRKALVAALAAQFNLHAEAPTKTLYTQLREPPADRTGWPADLDHPVRIPTATAHWREQARETGDLAETLWRTPGGLLRARLRWDHLQGAPGWLEIGGSVQVQPPELFARLGAGLVGVRRADLPERLRRLCREAGASLLGFGHADLLALLTAAWDRHDQQRAFGLSLEQANRLTLVAPQADAANASSLLRRSDTLLIPYCARPPACRAKPLEDCCGCNGCEVGDACRIAEGQGLEMRELVRYADLEALLAELRAAGSTGVIGMTCQTFFIKHSELFTRAGLPMLLVDLTGTTCYELQQEADGYDGTFPYQTRLDVSLLQKLLRARAPAATRRVAALP